MQHILVQHFHCKYKIKDKRKSALNCFTYSNVEGQFQLECDLRVKPSYSNTIVGRLRSLGSDLDESEIRGKLCLDSGQDPLSSFANKGIGRYAIQTSTAVTMELTIAFWLDDDESEEQKLVTPIDQDILRYCQAGDYLTFYVKGETYPVRSCLCEEGVSKLLEIRCGTGIGLHLKQIIWFYD